MPEFGILNACIWRCQCVACMGDVHWGICNGRRWYLLQVGCDGQYDDLNASDSSNVTLVKCQFKTVYFWWYKLCDNRFFMLLPAMVDLFFWLSITHVIYKLLSLSRSFYLLCLAKEVFSPVPPYCGYLKPSHLFVLMFIYLVSPY